MPNVSRDPITGEVVLDVFDPIIDPVSSVLRGAAHPLTIAVAIASGCAVVVGTTYAAIKVGNKAGLLLAVVASLGTGLVGSAVAGGVTGVVAKALGEGEAEELDG